MTDFLQYKHFHLDRKEVLFDESIFDGYSSGMGNVDLGDDIIEPTAFEKTIRERLTAGKVKLLDQHSTRSTKSVWGSAIEARVDPLPNGFKVQNTGNPPTHLLWTRFAVSKADPDAQVALGKVAEGHLDALSIGYKPIKVEYMAEEGFEEDPEWAWLIGRGTRTIKELAWYETSLVIWGMNEEAVTIQNSVKNILAFTQKISKEGKHFDESKVREIIRALNGMLERPELLPAEEISGNVKRLEEMVQLLGAKYRTSVVDDLRDIYSSYRKEHDSVTKESFMVWVSENIFNKEEANVAEDTDGSEVSEDVPSQGGLEALVELGGNGSSSETSEGKDEGREGSDVVVTFKTTLPDVGEPVEEGTFVKFTPLVDGTTVTWEHEWVTPTKETPVEGDAVETVLDDIEDVVHSIEESASKAGDAPIENADTSEGAAGDTPEGHSEHSLDEVKELSQDELELALIDLMDLQAQL